MQNKNGRIMQKFHKTNKAIKNIKSYMMNFYMFVYLMLMVAFGIILIGYILIRELFSALKNLPKKGTIPQQQYTKMDSREIAMQRWRQ